MIKKQAVPYTIILFSAMALTLSNTFLDLERVWAQISYFPPNNTTIISAEDGNYNQVQNGGSTTSRIMIFKVIAAQGTNPLEGFQCNLDGAGFHTCGHVVILKSAVEPTKDTYDTSGFPCSLDGAGFSICATSNPDTISYGNLAVGSHTIQIRAVDIQGDIDRYPATFSWTILTPTQVLTPMQEIQNIITTIDDMNLPSSITTRLEDPLNSAIRLLDTHQDVVACKSLDSFLQIVNVDAVRNLIIQQQTNELIQQATTIQQSLGCHSAHLFSSSPSSSPYDTYNDFIGPLVSAP